MTYVVDHLFLNSETSWEELQAAMDDLKACWPNVTEVHKQKNGIWKEVEPKVGNRYEAIAPIGGEGQELVLTRSQYHDVTIHINQI